ncbi:stage II sporulation protein M [Nocardioides nanhaiensis]|uniref:Stage II sporulation protein M n=1 Tax=Nocardioides nanhaiensis TaxID=1476871 RepID=A0ABP8VVX6_9ACTN
MVGVDLDAYVLAHSHQWQRLDELTRRPRLTGAEADELVERYQQVATHLSVVRTSAPDPTLVAHLSSLLARARNRAVGTRTSTWAGVRSFLLDRFPAALYTMRWWWLGCVAGSVLVTAVMTWWLLGNPAVEQAMLSPAEVDQLVNNDFEGYYSEYAASHFAAQVWINNAWVAGLCIALGVLGAPVVLLLFYNLANLAVIGSIMIRNDRGDLFFGLILPHGLLELTAVFVAGGVGLRLFWSWVEPGDRTRADALAQAGRSAATVALGLVLVLLVSGVIEAFVTPSGLPTWARVGIGVLAELCFFAYVFVLGRNAVLRGHTGDVDRALLEDTVVSRA